MITEALTCVGPDKLRRTDGAPVEWVVADGEIRVEDGRLSVEVTEKVFKVG